MNPKKKLNGSAHPSIEKLTLGDVHALRAEIADIRETLAAKEGELSEVMEYLGVVSPGRGTSTEDEAPPLRPLREQGMWTTNIIKTLEAAGRGLSHAEMRERMEQIPVIKTNWRTGKSFYNAMRNLMKSGELVRHQGVLYLPSVFAELRARGEKLPKVDARARPRGTAAYVLGILKEHPDGLTGPALKEALVAIPGITKSLRVHDHYLYTTLAAMIQRGEVAKNDETYLLQKAKG